MNLAASIQQVTEDVMLRAVGHLHAQTGMKNLCLSGGVALNCVGNGRIQREGPFERVWIQPASGDAGGALGAALLVWHQILEQPRTPVQPDAQRGSFLGPAYSEDAIRTSLEALGARYRHVADEDQLCAEVADCLARQQVVGWFQGRMEFGPRALGGRSILGDARSGEMQSLLNRKIKFRESFRPFAPIVLAQRAGEFFQLGDGQESPYMLLVAPVAPEKRIPAAGPPARGLERLKTPRSVIPAVTHVDHSARVQTADPARHGRTYKLLRAFDARTGCPLLINTSFNVRGEPIVCTPEDAYRCFMATGMDLLVLERFMLFKAEQPRPAQPPADGHLAQFPPD
jgi:carbamoyltransferase